MLKSLTKKAIYAVAAFAFAVALTAMSGPAKANELRTAPLWGLRLRPAYLHDGRSGSPDTAIRAHTGEAQNSRDKYVNLTDAERRQLLDFLNTL